MDFVQATVEGVEHLGINHSVCKAETGGGDWVLSNAVGPRRFEHKLR